MGITRKHHSVVPVALIAVLTLLSMPPKASGAPEKAPATAPGAAAEEFAPGRVIAKFHCWPYLPVTKIVNVAQIDVANTLRSGH